MGKRGPESYMKRQKELKRKQKAQEKMARRQGKRLEPAAGADMPMVQGEIAQETQGQEELQNQEPTTDL
jgi:hypothetical protein